MMRKKFGEKPTGVRDDRSSESEDLKWTQAKTAKKLGIAAGPVSEAIIAEAFIEKRPDLMMATCADLSMASGD